MFKLWKDTNKKRLCVQLFSFFDIVILVCYVVRVYHILYDRAFVDIDVVVKCGNK